MAFEPPVHPITGEQYEYRPQRRAVECMHLTTDATVARIFRTRRVRTSQPKLTKAQLQSFIDKNKEKITEMTRRFQEAREAQAASSLPQILEQIPAQNEKIDLKSEQFQKLEQYQAQQEQNQEQHQNVDPDQQNAEVARVANELDALMPGSEGDQFAGEPSNGDEVNLEDVVNQKTKIDAALENANPYLDPTNECAIPPTLKPQFQEFHLKQETYDDPLAKLINTNSAMKLKNEMATYMPEIIEYIDLADLPSGSQGIVDAVRERQLADRHAAPFLQPFSYRGRI